MSDLLTVERLPFRQRMAAKQSSPGVHYALASAPPIMKPRVRPDFKPQEIDARFLVDRIRPYPEWPLICSHANLPAFETDAEAMAWNNLHGHMPILAKWTCSQCWMVHYWSTSASDSNGAYASGAGEIPQHVKELMA